MRIRVHGIKAALPGFLTGQWAAHRQETVTLGFKKSESRTGA